MIAAATIVGPGKMGLALGYALVQAGAVERLTVCGRREEPPAHPLFTQGTARYVFGMEPPPHDTSAVFLAVPDAVIPELAHTLAAQGPAPEGCAAFHLSGSMPTDVLAPLHVRGYAVGAFHVLQSVVHPVTGAERIPGSYVSVTGSPEATAVARVVGAALGCPLLTVPAAWRPLYDAAVSLASDYLPPLLDLAARLLEQAGVDHEDALPALLPLVQGSLQTIAERGVEASVGGPVARGDIETVALHMRALDPDDRRLYAIFGRELAGLVKERLPGDVHSELLERFDHEIGG